MTSASTAARLAEGLALQQQGRLDDAEAHYLDVLEAEPTHTEAMKLMAILMVSRGEPDEALNYAEAAANLQPANGDYLHLLGRIQMDMGDADSALLSLTGALGKNPTAPAELNLDLAGCHGLLGDWAQSLAVAENQVRRHPVSAQALYAAATAAAALEKNDLAVGYFERAVAVNPDDPAVWIGVAKLCRTMGNIGKAWIAAERALSLSPEDPDLHYMTRLIRTEAVPAWHFNMMNDTVRNAAFRRAFARQIKPDHVVLEIGTGAGLLAMMAARGGARVYTCETNTALALSARGIIEHNGLKDRVSVIDKPSWEVQVGVDLPRQADVLVAEIFSAQFLSEEVIPTIEDAKRRLLKPGGIVIPAGGAMIGALVRNDEMTELSRVGVIEGFDVSSFNAFTPVLMNLDTPNYDHQWMSDPVEMFAFDFQNNDLFPAESAQVAVEVTSNGLCQGVVQWLRLALDDETTYENPPGGPKATRTKHWTPLFYPFAVPRELTKGQTVMLRVAHDRKGVRVELAGIL
jgi:tetratricopeptide (TPR) repeat protein